MKKTTAVTVAPELSVQSYRTEVEVLVVYNGSVVLNVDGCKSGHRYMFAPKAIRSIDVNDAACLMELGVFTYV